MNHLVNKRPLERISIISKVRHYAPKSEIKNIYHAIFESHLRYGCQIWFLSNSEFIKDKIEKLQKKAFVKNQKSQPGSAPNKGQSSIPVPGQSKQNGPRKKKKS